MPFGPNQLTTITCGTCKAVKIPDKQNSGSEAVAPMVVPPGLILVKSAVIGLVVENQPEPIGLLTEPNTTPKVNISNLTPVK